MRNAGRAPRELGKSPSWCLIYFRDAYKSIRIKKKYMSHLI